MKTHNYSAKLNWVGNTGTGTADYKAYKRDFVFSAAGKPDLHGSSDPAFRGDKTRYNPEELLLMALSSCHMLWFLHLCSDAGVIVTAYTDNATGAMEEDNDGSGRFTEVVLKPAVTVANATMIDKANSLHHAANKMCFIANSVNFPVKHVCTCDVA